MNNEPLPSSLNSAPMVPPNLGQPGGGAAGPGGAGSVPHGVVSKTGFDPVSGVAAVLFPGLGHIVRGDRMRGVAIAIGLLGLVLCGYLTAGIDAIDSKEDRVWFFGQAALGPIAFGLDRVHQNQFKGLDPAAGTRDRRACEVDETLSPKGEIIPIVVENGVRVARYYEGNTEITMTNVRPPYVRSLGRMNEMGMLFVTVAGLLNIVIIIDAFFPTIRTARAG